MENCIQFTLIGTYNLDFFTTISLLSEYTISNHKIGPGAGVSIDYTIDVPLSDTKVLKTIYYKYRHNLCKGFFSSNIEDFLLSNKVITNTIDEWHNEEQYFDMLKKSISKKYSISKWSSEKRLFILFKTLFKDTIYQYRTEWLDGQSLDVFIPSLKLAIEYNGIQHYKDIKYFSSSDDNRLRDEKKKEKCEIHNIQLFEWDYLMDVTLLNVYTFYNKNISKCDYDTFKEFFNNKNEYCAKELLEPFLK